MCVRGTCTHCSPGLDDLGLRLWWPQELRLRLLLSLLLLLLLRSHHASSSPLRGVLLHPPGAAAAAAAGVDSQLLHALRLGLHGLLPQHPFWLHVLWESE
jgi:hypothetical protein